MRQRAKNKRAGNTNPPREITVFSSPRERHRGLLRCGSLVLRCALGRSGVTHMKREGDGATPAGRHRLLSLIVRPDRIRPRSALPTRALRKTDGWCEDPNHGSYNRPIRLPSPAGHETMWRADGLYDVVGVLDWNVAPRVSRRGSAIFLHLARPGYGPTAGCIALNRRALGLLLAAAGRHPRFRVSAKPQRRIVSSR
jgi:L,D-peptidoglycan transpeptidase YkuD (ErfK/YbiS/YcfS/YnhG family)